MELSVWVSPHLLQGAKEEKSMTVGHILGNLNIILNCLPYVVILASMGVWISQRHQTARAKR